MREPNEEIQSYQIIFDQSCKFEMHSFAPKLCENILNNQILKVIMIEYAINVLLILFK